MNILRKLFSSTRTGEQAYAEGMALFNREEFKPAVKLLEESTTLSPLVAQHHFSLAACCMKVATDRDDEVTHRSWTQRGVDAFEKSVRTAEQYGGLAPDQLAFARDAVTNWNRIKATPAFNRTLSEEDRKQIYFEVWQAFADELLRQFQREPPRTPQAYQACADRAVACAQEVIGLKWGIDNKEQVAIDKEGKAKHWPQPKLK